MSAAGTEVARAGAAPGADAAPVPLEPASLRRRIRNGALGLAGIALAFYLGFIVMLVLRSHH
jgi:hypothetical protein